MRVVALALLLALPLVASAQPAPWPDGRYNPFGEGPVNIFLDFSNLTPETTLYADEVRAALRYWEQGGNGQIQWNVTFVEVATREEADVVFWLRDSNRVGPVCNSQEDAAGCARPFDRPVPIEVVMRLEDGSFRPFRLIHEVSAHEIGHALGLPHSDRVGDIMAPHVSHFATRGWRPGDWGRLAGGTLLGLAMLGALTFVLLRMLRPRARVGRVEWMSPEDEAMACPAASDGLHDMQPARIRVRGAYEDWFVCAQCRRGRRAEP